MPRAPPSGAKEPKPRARQPLKRACDQCHFRRVRCSHEQPCVQCVRLKVPCTYAHAHRDRVTTGKRIEHLRRLGDPQPQDAYPQGEHPQHSQQARGSSGAQPPPSSTPPSPPSHLPTPAPLLPPPLSQSHPPLAHVPSRPHLPPQSHLQRSPSQLPRRPQPPLQAAEPPSLSQSPQHLQPATFAFPQPSWSPSNLAGAFSLPDLDQSLAAYFNAQPAGSRENFFDWSFMAQSHAPAPDSTPSLKHGPVPVTTPITALGTSDTSPASGLTPPLLRTGPSTSSIGPTHNTPSLAPAPLGLGDMLAFDPKGPRLLDSLAAPMVNASLSLLDPPPRPPSASETGSVALRFDPVHELVPRSSVSSNEVVGPPDDPALALPDLDDALLYPRLSIFFQRLQPALPVFRPDWLYSRIRAGEHRRNVNLASMLLGMSALVLIQPIEGKEQAAIESNMRVAERLMEDCVRVRTSILFGKDPSLESIMASFFLFACLFGMRQDNAAWFRLHEAISLGCLLGLHEPTSYDSLAPDEQERRLRAYWLLAITERAYALQRGHSLGFRGHPIAATQALRAKLQITEFSDFPEGVLALFEHVDEHFVDCWRGQCPAKHGLHCSVLTASKAEVLAQKFDQGFDPSLVATTAPLASSPEAAAATGSSSVPMSGLSSSASTEYSRPTVQLADVEITRQWLMNRLWLTCLRHRLVSFTAPHPILRMDRAFEIAETTMIIVRRLPLVSMEAHGIGLTEKLYDIAVTLTVLYHQDPALASSMQKHEHIRPYTSGPRTNAAWKVNGSSNNSGGYASTYSSSMPNGRRRSSLHLHLSSPTINAPRSMPPPLPQAPQSALPTSGMSQSNWSSCMPLPTSTTNRPAAHASPSTVSTVSTLSRGTAPALSSSATSSPASSTYYPIPLSSALTTLSPEQRGVDCRGTAYTYTPSAPSAPTGGTGNGTYPAYRNLGPSSSTNALGNAPMSDAGHGLPSAVIEDWSEPARHHLLSRIPRLLRDYLSFFRIFRGGDHPFLSRLVQAIYDLGPLTDPSAFAAISAEVGVELPPSES